MANRKVAALDPPRFAPFPGFSYIADNPGASFADAGGLTVLHNDLADPALGLYRALAELAGGLEMPGFCPVPPSAYHVTVWDGETGSGEAPDQSEWRSPAPLRLRFERLDFTDGALVALLEPMGDCTSLVQLRAELDRRSARSSPLWRPHVTLGYFAGEEPRCLPEQPAIGESIAFTTAGLYSFTDMATFWRVPAIPPAVHITLDAIRGIAEQKVLVSERWVSEVPLRNIDWRPVAESGQRQVQVSPGVELAVFDQRASQDRHYHRHATEFYCVLEGLMEIEAAGTVRALAAGDTIVVNPWTLHEVKRDRAFVAAVFTANSGGRDDKYVPRVRIRAEI